MICYTNYEAWEKLALAAATFGIFLIFAWGVVALYVWAVRQAKRTDEKYR